MSTVRVGTCGDYPPLTIEKDGQFSGLSVDLLNKTAKQANIEIEWVKTTWPELHKGLLSGAYDAAFGGINETPLRKETFCISEPVLPCGKCGLSSKMHSSRFNSVSDIDKEGVTIVSNPGGTNEAYCKSQIKNASVTVVSDNKQPFENLAQGTSHIMITDTIEALHRQNQTTSSENPLVSLFHDTPITAGHTVLLSRKDSPDGKALIACLNKFLSTSEGLDTLKNVTSTWLGTPLSRASKL
eukprot:TRINITY_DN7278_c0_g2_i1.p1 TRINITY_DN7278_c0_g2~~TRINITY_DN7278_c0_g2_i1.p1  ORF type:complete len:241 (+),score=39.29 TRINITY_DN7278_c0_g2_i1:48-770(+)